jgi:carboxyl-terminal processing protease
MKQSAKVAIHSLLYTLVCILVIATTFAFGYVTHAAHAPVTDRTAKFSVFWEVWELIDDRFYGDVPDATARTYGAIRGSLAVLEDPYTLFVEPRQREREQEELRGSFGGIGAWVERKPDGRIVLLPMEDRPAARAGVLAGDELIAVDGHPVTPDMPIEDVVEMVKGKVGQVVSLTIRREGVAEPLTIEVRREEIVVPSVTWELVEDAPTIGYIRLTIFNERTADELQEAIRELRKQGASKFVIDLRNNGGGLLSSAVSVASQFLRDGVVLYDSKSSGEETPYPVKGKGLALDDPIVVLINSGTASASEIVAGAIQDYERGRLIGTRTFGKASVQELIGLSDGSSLHVTSAHWLTPNRHEIDGAGLMPDIEIELTDEDRLNDRDTQLEQAIAYLEGE